MVAVTTEEKRAVTAREMGKSDDLFLSDGSRIGVIGGGPAGAFFSFFLLQLAERIGISLQVDIFERRDFSQLGPTGCNMCGGVISESLVQALSVEGVNLPSDVVQRGIDSFAFHTSEETTTLYAPFQEMRIATVYRGAGPKGTKQPRWKSFDRYILELAINKGANVIQERVTNIVWADGKPQIQMNAKEPRTYDLLVGAIGVNTPSLELFEKLGFGYKKPGTRKTANMEFELGADYINTELGNSMHAFLLDLPKLEFAAIIPKGDYVTTCLIGDDIDSEFVNSFVKIPTVAKYLAGHQEQKSAACRCAPLASMGDAVHPFGDRVLMLGDCGMTRLNKDGIGSAYRVAKAAAVAALFRGISSDDFTKGYWPICQAITRDNRYGKIIYWAVGIIKKNRFLTRAVMRMARWEQTKDNRQRRISRVLWDMFTGSAPYRDVFYRCLHPAFIGRLIWSIFVDYKQVHPVVNRQEESMNNSALGKTYHAGEVLVKQGETGDSMYVIQSGKAEVIQSKDGQEFQLAVLGINDIFGEMAIFQKETRSATVRALTDVRVLTIDKRIFMRRVHEDPSFVFPILQKMSQRIRNMDAELTRLRTET